MKGRTVSKPSGLHAKKWREASQMRGFANVLPQPHAGKNEPLWKKPEIPATHESAELVTPKQNELSQEGRGKQRIELSSTNK
jgi:hypothetical protein